MALSIKSDEADRLARELARRTGESITHAVEVALRERLERARQDERRGITERLRRLADDVHRLRIVDARPPDVLVGYDDEHGLPA